MRQQLYLHALPQPQLQPQPHSQGSRELPAKQEVRLVLVPVQMQMQGQAVIGWRWTQQQEGPPETKGQELETAVAAGTVGAACFGGSHEEPLEAVPSDTRPPRPPMLLQRR